MDKKFTKVHVIWYDAGSHDPWQAPNDLDEKSTLCNTIGYLCKETKNDIYVASTFSSDGDVCCTMQIPKRCIKKMIKVKNGK